MYWNKEQILRKQAEQCVGREFTDFKIIGDTWEITTTNSYDDLLGCRGGLWYYKDKEKGFETADYLLSAGKPYFKLNPPVAYSDELGALFAYMPNVDIIELEVGVYKKIEKEEELKGFPKTCILYVDEYFEWIYQKKTEKSDWNKIKTLFDANRILTAFQYRVNNMAESTKEISARLDEIKSKVAELKAGKGLWTESLKLKYYTLTDVAKPRFNYDDFVSNNFYHISMNGVLHQDGFRVATDGYILVAVKDEYSSKLEGKIILSANRKKSILKNPKANDDDYFTTTTDEKKSAAKFIVGNEITMMKYPNWRGVIPRDYNKSIKVDFEKLLTHSKRLDKYSSLWKKDPEISTQLFFADETNILLSAEYLTKFCNAAIKIGADSILYKDDCSPIAAQTENGTVLLMPKKRYGVVGYEYVTYDYHSDGLVFLEEFEPKNQPKPQPTEKPKPTDDKTKRLRLMKMKAQALKINI